MERLGLHPNIIGTIGICVVPPATALVLEFAMHGDLNAFTRKADSRGDLTPDTQLKLATDVATGMACVPSAAPLGGQGCRWPRAGRAWRVGG